MVYFFAVIRRTSNLAWRIE